MRRRFIDPITEVCEYLFELAVYLKEITVTHITNFYLTYWQYSVINSSYKCRYVADTTINTLTLKLLAVQKQILSKGSSSFKLKTLYETTDMAEDYSVFPDTVDDKNGWVRSLTYLMKS